jgi:hypothetical protein
MLTGTLVRASSARLVAWCMLAVSVSLATAAMVGTAGSADPTRSDIGMASADGMLPAGDGATVRISVGPHGVEADKASDSPAVSASGRFVAFSSWATNRVPGDACGSDVFVRDRALHRTRLVSVTAVRRGQCLLHGGHRRRADHRPCGS